MAAEDCGSGRGVGIDDRQRLGVELPRRRTPGSGRSRAARRRRASVAWEERWWLGPVRWLGRIRCLPGRSCPSCRSGPQLGQRPPRRPRRRPAPPARSAQTAGDRSSGVGRRRGLAAVIGVRHAAVVGWHAAVSSNRPGRPGGATMPQPSWPAAGRGNSRSRARTGRESSRRPARRPRPIGPGRAASPGSTVARGRQVAARSSMLLHAPTARPGQEAGAERGGLGHRRDLDRALGGVGQRLDERRVGAHAAVDPQHLDGAARCRPRPPRPGRRPAGRRPPARPAPARAGRCRG